MGKYALLALGVFVISFLLGEKNFYKHQVSNSFMGLGPPVANADAPGDGDDSDYVPPTGDGSGGDSGGDGGDGCSGDSAGGGS